MITAPKKSDWNLALQLELVIVLLGAPMQADKTDAC
jgi:hypothetical protein